jgi:hypothetical protein
VKAYAINAYLDIILIIKMKNVNQIKKIMTLKIVLLLMETALSVFSAII